MSVAFDITSPEFKTDPFPTLRRMRAEGPVVRTRLPVIGGVWLVTTYEAVNELLRDHRRFVRDGRNAGKSRFTDLQWWLSRAFRASASNMLAKDEPDHRRLRDLVEDAFRRRSVDGMRDRVGSIADRLLDEAVDRSGPDRTIDFVPFSRQFPLVVICELLGLPDEDRVMFTRWAGGLDRVTWLAGMLRMVPNMYRIAGYFRRQVRLCRQQPREGLLSLLVESGRSGDSLDEDELTAMAFLLLFAGHETTTHLISGGLLTLLDHPDAKAELMSDWTKVNTAVDELLRYNTPVQITKPRIAARDGEFHGRRLKQGEYLMAMLASANSDPAQFDEPERFVIDRSPNPHVAFGAGIHVCLGLKLARMEAATAIRRLLTRFPDLRLAIPRTDVRWTGRIGVRSLARLPIRLG